VHDKHKSPPESRIPSFEGTSSFFLVKHFVYIMRAALLFATAVVPITLAFPWLRLEGIEALLNHPEAQAEIRGRPQTRNAAYKERHQLGTGAVSGLADLLGGSLKATLDPVMGLLPLPGLMSGSKKFPEGT
jgi:hypothetical protein